MSDRDLTIHKGEIDGKGFVSISPPYDGRLHQSEWALSNSYSLDGITVDIWTYGGKLWNTGVASEEEYPRKIVRIEISGLPKGLSLALNNTLS